jgi:hypothetical protein
MVEGVLCVSSAAIATVHHVRGYSLCPACRTGSLHRMICQIMIRQVMIHQIMFCRIIICQIIMSAYLQSSKLVALYDLLVNGFDSYSGIHA